MAAPAPSKEELDPSREEGAPRYYDLAELFRQEEKRWRRELLPPALLLTLLAHAVVIFWILNAPDFAVVPRQQRPPIELSLEAIPEFVDTNPQAPEARAPETKQLSDRDQVAAQEKPSEKQDSQKPALEGELIESENIVSGHPFASELPSPVGVSEEAAAKDLQQGQSSQMAYPLPPSLQTPELENAAQSEEGFQRSPEPKVDANPAIAQPQDMGEQAPLPRPKVQIRRPSTILMQNIDGVRRYGVVAMTSKFSEAGAYRQRMYEAICRQWYLLLERQSYSARDTGAFVHIKFSVDKQGNLLDAKVAETSASQPATTICLDSVISRAPFGPWTQEMIDLLGESTEVEIRFHYR